MAIPKISTQSLDTVQHQRRVAESINNIISHEADDLRRQTEAEKLDGLTPINRAYLPGDVRRYGAAGNGSVAGGSGTDDAAAFSLANSSGHPVVVSGALVYRVGTNTTLTAALHIDGAQISVDSGVTLTINGPLEVLNSSSPFVGPGYVVYSAKSRPGRVENILPDRAAGVPIRGGCIYSCFGDSYTTGTGVDADLKYPSLLASRWNATESNHGQGGRGVTRAVLEAFLNLPKYGSRARIISLLAGFNDLHYGLGNPKTLVKLTDETKAFLANAFLKNAVAASDSAVTKTGTWNNATDGVWADKGSQSLGGHAMYSTTNADTIAYTFTGTNIVVGHFKGSTLTYTLCDFDVYIDSALIETISPNNTTDGNLGFPEVYEGLTHAVLLYTGLGAGSHTIELRMKSGNLLPVDYFGTLSSPGDCPSVLVGEIPFVNAAGYASPEAGRSKAIDEAGSAAIKTAVDTFVALGYPVAWVPINDYYDYQTNIQGDNDHPAVAGHVQIAAAFSAYTYALNYAAAPSCTFLKAATQSIPDVTNTAVTFSSALDDIHGFRDAANASRIYAPFSGTMRLTGVIVYSPSATGARDVGVYLNGGGLVALAAGAAAATVAIDQVLPINVSVPVASGDYVEIYTSQNSTGALNLQTTCQITAEMLR